MDNQMFCFQCEQTAGCAGCTGKAGVCGKTQQTANLQDELTGALVGLARSVNGDASKDVCNTIIDGLFTTVTNVNFNDSVISQITARAHDLGDASKDLDMQTVWDANEDVRSLKSLVLFGIRGVAAYAYHARALGHTNNDVNQFFVRALCAIGEDWGQDELLPIVLEVGEKNLACMEMLDAANTGAFGTPEPTEVTLNVEAGPFIVISGHDLHDLKQLLEQTEGRGVNVYTHGEMLPAHAYPELKKYKHLKGNFGTAWQNQQKEFDNLPAPVLFTTNCLMPPKPSYADRVFTTALVSYPEIKHIGEVGAQDASGSANAEAGASGSATADAGNCGCGCEGAQSSSQGTAQGGKKDFTPVIKRALELGGYAQDKEFSGINGGKTVTVGFGHGTVLGVADKVVEAVKAGDIKHFFLVGGCDGARAGRNYYTEFVKQTPGDTVVLTLACGKYRFNDIDLGTIGGLPRLMDVGQCNDAYGAIKIAVALAQAFECDVNDLPLSMVLSWYEQKAVCILLTLLHLGIKNIHLGPTLPAFISPNVLNILVENYAISPISTPEEDLKKLLG